MIDAVGSISVDGKNARVCVCVCIWSGHICVSPEAHNVQCDFRWILDPSPTPKPSICNAADLLHFQEAEREVAAVTAWGTWQ